MDTHPDLVQWRLAQAQLRAGEVQLRQREWDSKASRRVIGQVTVQNEVHRGLRGADGGPPNVQTITKFTVVPPARTVKVTPSLIVMREATALESTLTHRSPLNMMGWHQANGMPTFETEIGLHKGVAAKYKQQFETKPEVPPFKGDFNGLTVSNLPTKDEAAIAEGEAAMNTKADKAKKVEEATKRLTELDAEYGKLVAEGKKLVAENASLLVAAISKQPTRRKNAQAKRQENSIRLKQIADELKKNAEEKLKVKNERDNGGVIPAADISKQPTAEERQAHLAANALPAQEAPVKPEEAIPAKPVLPNYAAPPSSSGLGEVASKLKQPPLPGSGAVYPMPAEPPLPLPQAPPDGEAPPDEGGQPPEPPAPPPPPENKMPIRRKITDLFFKMINPATNGVVYIPMAVYTNVPQSETFLYTGTAVPADPSKLSWIGFYAPDNIVDPSLSSLSKDIMQQPTKMRIFKGRTEGKNDWVSLARTLVFQRSKDITTSKFKYEPYKWKDYTDAKLRTDVFNGDALSFFSKEKLADPMEGMGKPSGKRPRFEKGSQEAKDFMAGLRAKRKKSLPPQGGPLPSQGGPAGQ